MKMPKQATTTKGENDLKIDMLSTQRPLNNMRVAMLIMFQFPDPP